MTPVTPRRETTLARVIHGRPGRALLAGTAALLALSATGAHPAAAGTSGHSFSRPVASRGGSGRHVLLLSVDGLHQSDLTWYVRTHPASALARLVGAGMEYTRAHTPVPSDSFPGMVGQVTGGDPASTGVYYDDSFNRGLFPAGTLDCTGTPPGAEVTYFEALDRDPTALDAGQGLPGLPGSILDLTGDARSLLDPSQLPVDPASCKPVYPHAYLKVNTVFEVARAHGLRTAWSDKHPAYEILNGPSGTGVQDLFTPEINSTADSAGHDWTSDNALTQRYDGFKVQSVLNELDGFDHSGRRHVGVPAVFGMNFQSVSTAEKLPTSDGLAGGYRPDGVTPGPLLARALDSVDHQLGRLLDRIHRNGLGAATTVILSAKHGQSPQEPQALTRIDDGPLIDAVNAAWATTHPDWVAAHPGRDLVAMTIDDDALLWWLNDRSAAALALVRDTLLGAAGTGNGIDGAPKPYQHAGLSSLLVGAAAAASFHVPVTDQRVPDVVGVVQHGVVYTGKQKKIAEHGGQDPQDLDVPLVVSGAGVRRAGTQHCEVGTIQIAPTILHLLGLDPDALQAVRRQGTQVLPGL